MNQRLLSDTLPRRGTTFVENYNTPTLRASEKPNLANVTPLRSEIIGFLFPWLVAHQTPLRKQFVKMSDVLLS